MLKSLAILTAAAIALPSAASAYVHHTHYAVHHYHMLHHGVRGHSIHADGTCNGRVDGTGLTHHCGTATGGVPGGMPNRN